MDEFEKRKRQQKLKTGRKQGDPMPRKLKGGRAGFKSGSKGCKLAMKGKGRAYGKNS